MSRNRCRVTIKVTPQTIYHLQAIADVCYCGDIGKVVDRLVKEHQVAAKSRNKPKKEEGANHV